MNELKALFESSVLTDETKVVLQEAFDNAIAAREVSIKAEYDQKLKEHKAELMESVVALIEEAVTEELESISEEVKHARTLDVEYAEKLETFKENYAARMEEKVNTLVAEAVAEELDELKEDIDFAKKHSFALKLFESFKSVYEQTFGDEENIDVIGQLAEAKEELDAYKRKEKLEELLEGVTGRKRVVAMTILENVSIENMESRFNGIKDIIFETVKESDEEELNEEVSTEETPAGEIVLENVDDEGKDERGNIVDAAAAAKIRKTLKFATGK